MKKMQETKKMKAERGEGTITQWKAIQDWVGHTRRFVADNTGNWTDTVYWSKLKDKMYEYEQTYGMKHGKTTYTGMPKAIVELMRMVNPCMVITTDQDT
jgi:hypothetical protein